MEEKGNPCINTEMPSIFTFIHDRMQRSGVKSYAEIGRKMGKSTSVVCKVVRETVPFPWKNVNAWGDALGLDDADRKELLRLATEQRLHPSDPETATKITENTELYDDSDRITARDLRSLRREIAALRREIEKLRLGTMVRDTPTQPAPGPVLGAALPHERLTMRPAHDAVKETS